MKINKKVGIVYHYIAHYRHAIFQELFNNSNHNYTLISAKESGNNIKTIDPELAFTPINKGGFRWLFVKNKWLLKNRLLWQSGLISHLRKQNYDTVVFLGNIYYLSTWVAIGYLKLKRKKIFLWTHGVTSDANDIKWRFRKFFYSLTDGLLLYGHEAKNVMIQNGFKEQKLHVIYNSLDHEIQMQYRREITDVTVSETKKALFLNPELPYIVFVGRLTMQKKLDMIVEASKLLNEEGFKINTLFVGDGEGKEDLISLVNLHGLGDYFNFYGACYNESVISKLIGSADICVSPGEVGLTAITSLGYGTPVISHGNFNYQMPEYESIEPGINGDFFIHDSKEDLAYKIKLWINGAKQKSREQIRKNCFEIIDSKYNPKNQASLINEIISNS
ncbi:glycosyltransferase [Flavobacteriaceae bacterium KMM 6897]|nr:glycosyltransferase [Flavobacteriaceae bacterium KMM 6897]